MDPAAPLGGRALSGPGEAAPPSAIDQAPGREHDRPTDAILRLLDLDPVEEDAFLAPTPSEGPGRLFGGQVASQSLRAACLTVDESRPPHSLHAYFILPGRPGVPLRLDVQRSRDGRSFTTRHVTASQEGRPIFELVASFHASEPGDDWQLPAPDAITRPGEARPDALEPPELPEFLRRSLPFDIRPVPRARARRLPARPPLLGAHPGTGR